MINKNEQFNLTKEWYLNQTDFKDWTRYFYLMKTIQRIKPGTILEIGAGNHLLKNIVNIRDYFTIDLNKNLMPDFVCDIREHLLELDNRFDCIVCTEVLEHIPLHDVKGALSNICSYLVPGGRALIMLPFKKPYISISTPINPTPVQFTIPKFRNLKVVDPYHYWEIGLEGITLNQISGMLSEQFIIMEYKYIPYHGYWILEKWRKHDKPETENTGLV